MTKEKALEMFNQATGNARTLSELNEQFYGWENLAVDRIVKASEYAKRLGVELRAGDIASIIVGSV